MKKTFDCVELQHKGAEKVQAKLASMSLEEQVVFWEERGKELAERKRKLLARREPS